MELGGASKTHSWTHRQEAAPPGRSLDPCFQPLVGGSYLKVEPPQNCSPHFPWLNLLVSDTLMYECVFLEVSPLPLWGPWFQVSALNGNCAHGRVVQPSTTSCALLEEELTPDICGLSCWCAGSSSDLSVLLIFLNVGSSPCMHPPHGVESLHRV